MSATNGFKLDQFFAALADQTRLRLINLMRKGEVCVCFFAETLGTNNPKISRHLSYLKRAGLVIGRRDGKWMHYRLNPPADPQVKKLFYELLETLENDADMRSDMKNLTNVCCMPRFVELAGRENAKGRT